MFKNSWICWREQMKIVVKSLDDLISSTKELGNKILYVVTDEPGGTKVAAEICHEVEVPIYITKFKNKYDIEEVIYYDL